MRRFIFKQLQVFNPIIVKNPIDMMNFFFWVKKSAKMFFHYEAVFENIFLGILKGMIGRINQNITTGSLVFSHSRFPKIRFAFICFTNFLTMFLRKFNSLFFLTNQIFAFFRMTETSKARRNAATFHGFGYFILMRLRHFIAFYKHKLILAGNNI